MLLALMLAADTPGACVHPPLTAAARHAVAAAIGRRSGNPVRPSDVSDIMEGGRWRLVWATPAESERGVFFLRRSGATWHYVDVWGGVIAPDERAGTIKWARQRGRDFPPALAVCFAAALLAGK